MIFIIIALVCLGLAVYADIECWRDTIASTLTVLGAVAALIGFLSIVLATSPEQARCDSLDGKYGGGSCYVNGKEIRDGQEV